jgi:hypothetical protein
MLLFVKIISILVLCYLVLSYIMPSKPELYNKVWVLNLKTLLINLTTLLVQKSVFINKYYKRNELVWVDGFLLDFLQKKSADLWLRKFVIYTGFLFSERLVFDYVVRLYLDNLIWPMHHFGVLESENTTEMLSITVFFYFLLFSILSIFIILFL